MSPFLFLFALMSVVAYQYVFRLAAMGSGWEVVAVARSLANEGEFADPFEVMPTGPTALVPPVYPLLLAGILRLAGDGPQFGVIAFALAAMMHAALAALLPYASRAIFGDSRPGLMSSVLVIALPVFVVVPQHETIYLVGALVGCTLLLGWSAKRRGARVWKALVTGSAAGVTTLINPAAAVVIVPLSVYFVQRNRTSYIRGAARLALMAMCALIVCSPWLIRNYCLFGTFPTLRTNFGLEFHLANHAGAEPNFIANRLTNLNHPNGDAAEAMVYKGLGETAYNRRRYSEALDWIRSEPKAFAFLTLRRVREFWFPSTAAARAYAWTQSFVNLLAFAGIFAMYWRRHRAVYLVLSSWCLYCGVYSFFQVDIRYTYPIYWLSLLSAGYFITDLFVRLCGLARTEVIYEVNDGELR